MRYNAIALQVPDLEAAEGYYRSLFGLELVGREARLADGADGPGLWATLPPDKSWADARAAGVELTFTSLRREGFHLALMAGAPGAEQLYAIVVTVSADELAAIHAALTDETVSRSADEDLEIVDRYGFRWQLRIAGGWSTPGEFAGRWLDV